MTIPHELWLVALSVAIAIQGSFVGLSLSLELDTATGFRRRLALAGSALTLATGVWSMHFVGMLAANFPSAVDYLVLPTLVSFLICVIVVGARRLCRACAGTAAHADRARRRRDGARHLRDALCRHVGGASGRDRPTSSRPSSSPRSRFRSRRARLRFGRWAAVRHRSRLFLAAVVLGLAISGMHYTAMAGMRLDPLCFDAARFVGAESALSRNTLALLATVISFGVSGAFLLSLVPEGETAATPVASRAQSAPIAAGPGERVASDADRRPRRLRRRSPPRRPSSASRRTVAVAKSLVEDIYAIRANAHYSYVHDGEQEYFCNLSISALEAMLDPDGVLPRASQLHRAACRG